MLCKQTFRTFAFTQNSETNVIIMYCRRLLLSGFGLLAMVFPIG